MRSRDKLILIIAIVSGVVALTAGIAVAAASAGDDSPTTAVVSQEPANDQDGAGQETDDDGSTDGDGAGDDNGSSGSDESDTSLTGETATKAAEAALASTGGGIVLAVETDDDNAGYEVEIRAADGSEAEVELDKGYNVVQRGGED